MANNTKVAMPTLSSAGYVTDPKQIMIHLLANSVEIRYNDTNLFKGNIYSVHELLAKYGTDPTSMASKTRSMFEQALQDYGYDNIEVTVTTTNTDDNRYQINLSMYGEMNGTACDLQQILTVNPSTAAVNFLDNYG